MSELSKNRLKTILFLQSNTEIDSSKIIENHFGNQKQLFLSNHNNFSTQQADFAFFFSAHIHAAKKQQFTPMNNRI
jgi:hypothetical protein